MKLASSASGLGSRLLIAGLAASGTAQAPAPVSRPSPTLEETRRALAEVLADPQLHAALQRKGEGLLHNLGELMLRLQRWLQGLVDQLLELQQESPALFWVVFALLIAIAAALLTHIGWTLAQAVRAPRPRTSAAEPIDAERRAHSQALRARAQALAAAGDRRAGMRHLLLALLALVEERRLLAVARSWTVREILARLAGRAPGLFRDDGPTVEASTAAPLPALSARIERACYAEVEVPAADFAAVDHWLDRVLRIEPRAAGR